VPDRRFELLLLRESGYEDIEGRGWRVSDLASLAIIVEDNQKLREFACVRYIECDD
jgi:hypothetical protein